MASSIFEVLLDIARDLSEPGEPNREYIRGQAELIVDAMGLTMDGAKEPVMQYIAHEIDLAALYDDLERYLGEE